MRSKIEIYKLCNRYNRNKPEDTEYSRIRLRHIDSMADYSRTYLQK